MELHIIFFILAGLLIAVLIGSSILSNRREKSRIFSNTFSQRPPSSPIHSQQMPSDDRHFDLQEQTQERVNQAEIDIPSSVEIQRDVENSLSEIKIRITLLQNLFVQRYQLMVNHNKRFMSHNLNVQFL